MTDGPSSTDPSRRLDSWKDIAAYLKRDVSTVQRWEKREGMPVHRHLHDKIGSVFAFTGELDEWARGRRIRPEPAVTERPIEPAVEPSSEPAFEPAEPAPGRWLLVVASVAFVALVAGGMIWLSTRDRPAEDNPLTSARFVRLTDFEGVEEAAAISPDGRFVAFLSNRGGAVDVWVTQIGTGQFQNLTRGKLRELVNPDIRMLGFSPDGALTLFWMRRPRGSGAPDISIWAVPTLGGEPRIYLDGAAELAWSNDGKRLVYHTPAAGDPMFIRDGAAGTERKLFTGTAGLHNHYPVWSRGNDFVYFVSGHVPDELDVWRIGAQGGGAERLTSHDSRVSHLAFLDERTLAYLATDVDGAGPWLYALDLQRKEARRISSGVERYTSIDASSDARHLVMTVANVRRALWRLPVGDAVANHDSATRVGATIVGGRSPRVGRGFLLYVSSRSDSESIWKLEDGSATELTSLRGARVIGGPAISRDGARVAFAAEERGTTRLYVMSGDGSGLRPLGRLQPRSAPSWSPDGRSLAVAALVDAKPVLALVTVDSGSVSTLAAGFAADPVWSPDGTMIVYSGREVGTTFPLQIVRTDGTAPPQPKITLTRGARRMAFLPDGRSIVVLRGDMVHKDFWAIDLATGAGRRLSSLGREVVIGDFDVSPDGREIVFDREQDDADVVLVERPSR